MKILRTTGALAIVALGLALSGAANATTYDFSGTISSCTTTCDSFPALTIGSLVEGSIDINTSANGSWAFADINSFLYTIFNPALPVDTTNPNAALLNPLPLVDVVAPIRDMGTGALAGFVTGGTTDANNDLSGTIVHEFVVAPFDSNGAWAIFNIGAGGATTIDVCLFATAAGCTPDLATAAVQVTGTFSQAVVPIPAAVWLFGSALLGFAGLGRRKTA